MLTSTANPLIKQITALHSAKGRQKQRRCIAEGMRTLETMIRAGWRADHIYATSTLYHDAIDKFQNIPITAVSDTVMNKISAATTPSGILGVFPLPGIPDPKKLSAGIVLAGIADPGNMGTLIRSCAAFDKHSVVVIEGCDPFAPKVIQSTAGTIAHVTIFEWTWQELLQHKGSLELICLVSAGGMPPEQLKITEGLLVIGSEAHGVPPLWQADCEHKVTIPMPGGTESLNAGVAGSIGLYALWTGRKY
ncbi:MAG: TrmH family RNA methyltransferase [Candidatus Babeliales bacterium]